MVLRYVWKNFRRRRVRTMLMMLSLIISTGLIVAMSATVETIRRSNADIINTAVGRFDMTLTKTEISPDPFILFTQTSEQVKAANSNVTAVYPRFQALAEFEAKGDRAQGWLLALDPTIDDVGFIDVISGTYTLGDGQIALLEDTANTFNLRPGDSIEVAYSFPQPREEGQVSSAGASQRRAIDRFTIAAIVRQDGVTDGSIRQGVILHINDVQQWLGLPDRAQQLIILLEQSLYEGRNAETAALRVREVGQAIYNSLGDDYVYNLSKAIVLQETAQAFLILQALINTYGLMALGVVGLLIHTLVMTNVQEQRRDMAIFRILGSERGLLFALVLGEIAVIGAIGIGIGIVAGQLLNQHLIVPLIQRQIMQAGITTPLRPEVTLASILPAILSAIFVLFISALQPARDAARTKVMHAINPGVADNIQIEDLAQLRQRSPNTRLFAIGMGLLMLFALIASFEIFAAFGNPLFEVFFFLGALGVMVLGVSFVFFIITVPFERLILTLISPLLPRLTYFAKRNVRRGQMRNTLISLLVLFSGVLPSFLATQTAISNANLESNVLLDIGSPLRLNVFGGFGDNDDPSLNYLRPSFINEELAAVPGLDQAVGLSYSYQAAIGDSVGMRNTTVNVRGVNGRLDDVLFSQWIEFAQGDQTAFAQLFEDPNNVIISQGLADYLAIPLGGTLKLTGAGLDHVVNVRVVGIARRIPSFDDLGRSRTLGQGGGSGLLISLDGFRALITEPKAALPPENDPIFNRIMLTTLPDFEDSAIVADMRERYGFKYSFWIDSATVRLEEAEREQAGQQIFLLVLTGLSFTTAVFGVFAVIYVTIYARRLEIGMMKAIGTRRWELTGMLVVESIAMTLSAALAGIAAGATMGYVASLGELVLSQRPFTFALDTTVMPFIVIMVVLASVLGATFSARRIVKKRAVEILRMQ